MDEREARLALASVVEPGTTVGVLADVRAHGAEAAWGRLVGSDADTGLVARARAYRVAQAHRLLAEHRLRFVVPGDPEWPPGLDDLADSDPVGDVAGDVPLGLWVTGPDDLAALSARSVAVVGSRAATGYGQRTAYEIGAGVVAARVTVVSGGAYGIDAAAHRGALSEGGPTVAVMAGGLHEVYPCGNTRLLHAIRDQCVLVSENPPGQSPNRMRFLARNRLIAAMSQATLVVEARVRSGARNTVAWAQRMGRVVLAVPGEVGSAQSETPLALIRDHEAVLVRHAADVVAAVGPLQPDPVRPDEPPRRLDGLDQRQRLVYEAFPARAPVSVDELSYEARLTARECLSALTVLERGGLVTATDDGRWRLVRVR